MPNKHTVVLIHGLGGSRLDMWQISRRLRQERFHVINWGYRSIGNRIEFHADRLRRDLQKLEFDQPDSKFHLITHSMGGIIARAVIAEAKFERLGRVVMLAPPHHGSHAARKLAPWIGWLSPSLRQLSDESGSYVNRLPNSLDQQGIEFGIIEAQQDRVIKRGTVYLNGAKDFASVDGHHGILTWYAQTTELVSRFLQFGNFSNEEFFPKTVID